MTWGIGQLATTFFSQFTNDTATPGELDVRSRGAMVKVGHYRRPSDPAGTPIPGIVGNWAPVNETEDVQEDGIRKLGDIDVFTHGDSPALEVPNGPVDEPGVVIHTEIGVFQLYNRQVWPYARGYRYTGRLLLSEVGQG